MKHEEEYPIIITAEWDEGELATGPTYSCGGTPGYPAHWEIESITLDGVELELTDSLTEWAEGKLGIPDSHHPYEED